MGPIGAAIILGSGLIVLASAITIIRPYEKRIVERLGKFRTTLDPGFQR